jgi:hypothetical protein
MRAAGQPLQRPHQASGTAGSTSASVPTLSRHHRGAPDLQGQGTRAKLLKAVMAGSRAGVGGEEGGKGGL